MKTCAYCGTELEGSYCPYCELVLSEKYINEDGKRVSNRIEAYPDESMLFKSTRELMTLETIELLYLLRYAREHRSMVYHMRINVNKAAAEGNDMSEYDQVSYKEYEQATRKVWSIENMIKDRIGYYPQKITEQFLASYLERIERSEVKPMKIYKKEE
jgi:hypothetical protein